jgi:hypothetical protein
VGGDVPALLRPLPKVAVVSVRGACVHCGMLGRDGFPMELAPDEPGARLEIRGWCFSRISFSGSCPRFITIKLKAPWLKKPGSLFYKTKLWHQKWHKLEKNWPLPIRCVRSVLELLTLYATTGPFLPSSRSAFGCAGSP